jgi:hypothetical protein
MMKYKDKYSSRRILMSQEGSPGVAPPREGATFSLHDELQYKSVFFLNGHQGGEIPHLNLSFEIWLKSQKSLQGDDYSRMERGGITC